MRSTPGSRSPRQSSASSRGPSNEDVSVAMVQAIENRSDVRGRVERVVPHPTLDQYALVQLALDDAKAVKGYAHLVDAARDGTITVAIPAERVRELNVGAGNTITAR